MAERITFTLHELVATIDGYADEILQSRFGVSFSTFHFISVAATVEPVDITTLARCLGVTKAAVSKRVPLLVKDGWITTSADPRHGRRVLVSLTAAATTLVDQAGGVIEAAFRSLETSPRLRESGIDLANLNTQLNLLTAAITEMGLSE